MKVFVKFCIALAMLAIVSCEEDLPEPIPVTSVSLNAETLEMEEGEEVTLTATVSPKDADNKSVIWSSSNLSIVSVEGGKVRAHKPGKAIVIVKTDDGGKTATCEVTVNAKVYSVTGITLDKTTATLTEGEELTLSATVTPDNATNKVIIWSSSDKTVASVSDGQVTALKVGNATITAKSEDGGKTATCEISVIEKVFPVESVFLDKTSIELTEGDESTLTATITPDNATNKNVTWISSDESVAIVENGKVTAIKEGTATITVITEDGNKTSTCEVTVDAKVFPVESVSIDKSSIEVYEGSVTTLVATISPENATNKNVTWTSSDESIATIDNGKVAAIKEGTTTITVNTEDGGKTDFCKIIVKQLPIISSLSINKSSFNAYIGQQYSITASISPDNARYDLEWVVSDNRVARVVSANATNTTIETTDYGVAEISVIDKISGISSSITINTIVENFTWQEETEETLYGYPMATIEVGQEYQLKYSQSPEYATELFSDLTQFIFYDSQNIIDAQDYILIKENGLITGLKAGIVGIKPTGRILSDGSRLYIKIKDVEIPVERITLDQTSIELTEGDETTLSATITPETATNKNVIWLSSNEEVATVEKGKVTAQKEGTATITVTTEDGNKTATCEVTVNAKVYPVTGVTLDKTSVTLTEGEEITLSATVNPDNATNKTITWLSSYESVATVSDGKVTAMKAGTATITVSTEDGNKTAICEIIVKSKGGNNEELSEDEGSWGWNNK